MDISCILCASGETFHFFKDDTTRPCRRDYYRCGNCRLIFVRPDQRLVPAQEHKRYDLHENDPEDPRYRKFLSRLFYPLQERISPHSFGLDFGSGPGPALSRMFEEAGHTVRLFDIFYENDPSVFSEDFDFISTSETVEHLYRPLLELDRLWKRLRCGGWLGIMTGFAEDSRPFADWHYKDEETHVAFYSRETFRWIAERWKTEPEFTGRDVVLFRKTENFGSVSG